jgi:hypothetical protein
VPSLPPLLRRHRTSVALAACVAGIALLLGVADVPRAAAAAFAAAAAIAVGWIAVDVVQAGGRDRGKHDRDLLALAAAGLLVGLVGLGIAGWWASSVHDLLGRLVTTTGTVVEHHQWRRRSTFIRQIRGRDVVYGPVVRFELPDRAAVVFKSPEGHRAPPFPAIGEKVEVHYDPAEPQRSAWIGPRGDAWAGPRLVAWVGGGFALAGAWGIALFVRRGKRRGPCRS